MEEKASRGRKVSLGATILGTMAAASFLIKIVLRSLAGEDKQLVDQLVGDADRMLLSYVQEG